MRTSTDVKVTDNVSISRALYNNVKTRETAMGAARVMQRALNILRDHVDIPDNLEVRVCTFRNQNVGGEYSNYHCTAAIKLRNFRSMITSLAHELVHSEQYNQGRLIWNGSNYMWQGEDCNNKGSTYDRYRNLPWEVEAFNRQSSLSYTVFEEMGI
jgi:hypothetical protein